MQWQGKKKSYLSVFLITLFLWLYDYVSKRREREVCQEPMSSVWERTCNSFRGQNKLQDRESPNSAVVGPPQLQTSSYSLRGEIRQSTPDSQEVKT